ncbi:hypothetical protein DOY81_008992 [Sarcophaga bullata]|nr:hypothetical protein DOY81_008992 [Sarcophaga bullata]
MMMHPKDNSRDFLVFGILICFLFTQSNLKSNQQYFGNGFLFFVFDLRDLMDDERKKTRSKKLKHFKKKN